MLRGIHKASSNWLGRVVMGVLLGLIAISFGIWGIGDIFRGFGQSTVAKIGGTEIRVDQFRQLYQDRLQQISRRVGRPVTPDQARAFGIDRQLLAQVIAETVLDERAKKLGLGLAEAEVARRVMEDPNFRGLTGQFDRARFDYTIRQVGYTEARYLAEQRRSLVRQQLVGTVSGEFAAPKIAMDALNRYQNEQRTIEYVMLDRAQAGDIPAPTAEELAKYFEERKVMFRAPEYRKVLLLALTPAELATTFEVSDADLKKAYEERKARYVTAERRHILQIPFPNIEEARAAAERIAKGETFAALAAERGLKEPDIDLGTLVKSAMVDRAVADAAFELKEGEVSAPVEGRFGVVLLQVSKIEPSTTKAFEEVSAELKLEMAAERARAELLNVHDKVEDERLGGVNLADTAKKLNLKTRAIEAIDRSGHDLEGKPVADLPQGVDVLNAGVLRRPGRRQRSAANSAGRRLRLVRGCRRQAGARPPARRGQGRSSRRAGATTRFRSGFAPRPTEMLEKLKAGTPFAEVAGADNLKPEWRPGLKRNNPPPGIPARALDLIFRTPKDGVRDRRRRDVHRTHRVPRHRNQRGAARSPVGRRQAPR